MAFLLGSTAVHSPDLCLDRGGGEGGEDRDTERFQTGEAISLSS